MAVVVRFHGELKPCRGTGYTSREMLKTLRSPLLLFWKLPLFFETIITGAVFRAQP